MNYQDIIKDGIWRNNVGLAQLLGLCPLLAVTSSLVNGLGMGLATTVTLVISSTLIAALRKVIPNEIRIPVFVLIIAAAVTMIELTMNAYLHELYLVLGIFIPLIVTNCAIIGRAEAFASRNPVGLSVVDALAMGLGFTLVLGILGTMREILGFGTLFRQAGLMFGTLGEKLEVTLIDNYSGFLLAILPPGAFIGLGLIIAVKNIIDSRAPKANPAEPETQPAPAT
jgi:Na+-translocating ferredoxin:NAD+ oxidoreductase subunit E